MPIPEKVVAAQLLLPPDAGLETIGTVVLSTISASTFGPALAGAMNLS